MNSHTKGLEWNYRDFQGTKTCKFRPNGTTSIYRWFRLYDYVDLSIPTRSKDIELSNAIPFFIDFLSFLVSFKDIRILYIE